MGGWGGGHNYMMGHPMQQESVGWYIILGNWKPFHLAYKLINILINTSKLKTQKEMPKGLSEPHIQPF